MNQPSATLPETRILPCMLAGQWARIDWTEEIVFEAGKFRSHGVALFHCTKMGQHHCGVKHAGEWKKCPFMPRLTECTETANASGVNSDPV